MSETTNRGTRDKMAYYMPLTKGSPFDGPSPCVFSKPKMNYSQDTQKLIKSKRFY